MPSLSAMRHVTYPHVSLPRQQLSPTGKKKKKLELDHVPWKMGNLKMLSHDVSMKFMLSIITVAKKRFPLLGSPPGNVLSSGPNDPPHLPSFTPIPFCRENIRFIKPSEPNMIPSNMIITFQKLKHFPQINTDSSPVENLNFPRGAAAPKPQSR